MSGNAALPLERLIGATILIEWRAREGSDVRRPVHGHIIAAERIGYNGGLARFRLEVEPWLAVLRQRVDHYNFQNASVLDISEQIFGYHNAGSVVPAWPTLTWTRNCMWGPANSYQDGPEEQDNFQKATTG